jgi:uncharacterized protein
MADIVTAQVFHARTRPRRNAFRYGVYYLRIALDELGKPANSALFSIDRFNLFSLRNRDYHTAALNIADSVRAALDEFSLSEVDGEIQLITMPRILGFAFNPVSFWLCHDKAKNLRAVIATVSNTFGETHRYLCFQDDHRPIAANDWLEARKIFHVSPFLAVDGHYRFRFACNDEDVAIWINHHDPEGLILSTSLIGKARALTSGRLLFCFFRYPLVTLKVVALIHYQAVKLFLKGIRHYRKPEPPLSGISH